MDTEAVTISRNQPGAEETHAKSFSYVPEAGFLRGLFLELYKM
jgi:hypothetical protein